MKIICKLWKQICFWEDEAYFPDVTIKGEWSKPNEEQVNGRLERTGHFYDKEREDYGD